MPRLVPTTPGLRFRAQVRGGSLLHHVPNRRPWFPTSTPPPRPSAHPSDFSIRSQRDYFGFNPTAQQRLPFLPPLPRSSIPESESIISKIRAVCRCANAASFARDSLRRFVVAPDIENELSSPLGELLKEGVVLLEMRRRNRLRFRRAGCRRQRQSRPQGPAPCSDFSSIAIAFSSPTFLIR